MGRGVGLEGGDAKGGGGTGTAVDVAGAGVRLVEVVVVDDADDGVTAA